jgi:hypothetical protein
MRVRATHLYGIVMAGPDPAIPLIEAQPCHMIRIAGSSPAMTASGVPFPNMN